MVKSKTSHHDEEPLNLNSDFEDINEEDTLNGHQIAIDGAFAKEPNDCNEAEEEGESTEDDTDKVEPPPPKVSNKRKAATGTRRAASRAKAKAAEPVAPKPGSQAFGPWIAKEIQFRTLAAVREALANAPLLVRLEQDTKKNAEALTKITEDLNKFIPDTKSGVNKLIQRSIVNVHSNTSNLADGERPTPVPAPEDPIPEAPAEVKAAMAGAPGTHVLIQPNHLMLVPQATRDWYLQAIAKDKDYAMKYAKFSADADAFTSRGDSEYAKVAKEQMARARAESGPSSTHRKTLLARANRVISLIAKTHPSVETFYKNEIHRFVSSKARAPAEAASQRDRGASTSKHTETKK